MLSKDTQFKRKNKINNKFGLEMTFNYTFSVFTSI